MKIICLIGPSGSGKSTIGKLLKKKGYTEIISHTTRPIRSGESEGKSYYFIDMNEYKSLDKVDETFYAGNYYCISREEIKNKSLLSLLLFCIVTLSGYRSLLDEYGTSVVKSVFINSYPERCINRMKLRGDSAIAIKKRIKTFEESDEFKNGNRCDHVLDNNGSLIVLEKKLDELLEKI